MTLGGASFYKFAVAEPIKQVYADFCRSYDSMKDLPMKKAGVFLSAPWSSNVKNFCGLTSMEVSRIALPRFLSG